MVRIFKDKDLGYPLIHLERISKIEENVRCFSSGLTAVPTRVFMSFHSHSEKVVEHGLEIGHDLH
jgi:hypothetical protein